MWWLFWQLSSVCLPDASNQISQSNASNFLKVCKPRFNVSFQTFKSELKQLYLPALENEDKMLVFAANPHLLFQVSMLCCPVQVRAFPVQQPLLLAIVWTAYTGTTL
jgi:hypothetical protein